MEKKIVVRKYQSFTEAVLRALPADLDPITAQMWIENQKSLRNLLRQALMLSTEINPNAYPVVVDYGKSVNGVINEASCHNCFIDKSNINSDETWWSERGKVGIVLKLVRFNAKHYFTNYALYKIEDLGFRPADALELLAFGQKYPNAVRKLKLVVALGDSYGGGYCPCFKIEEKRIVLRLINKRSGYADWSSKWWFLVVSK